MTESNGDYRIDAQEEKLQMQAGVAELARIVAANSAGVAPDPADVAAVKALMPQRSPASTTEVDIPDLIGRLHKDDAVLQSRAWAEVSGHLPPEPLDRGTSAFPLPPEKRRKRTWLIKDWLPAGTLGMLTGTGAAGKSLLGLQMAVSMAAGQQEWIGRPGAGAPLLQLSEACPFRVVYATYEDELEVEVADRMDWIEKQSPAGIYSRLEGRLHIEPMDEPIWSPPVGGTKWQPSDLTTVGRRLRARCELHRADLLILDPLAEAAVLDEIDNAAIGDFVRSWRVWARQQRCAVMLLHHLSKTEALKSPDEDISGYRGGTAWQAGVRWLWMLQADKDLSAKDRPVAQLRPLKASYALLPKEVTLYRGEKTEWIWQARNDQAGAGQNETRAGSQ